MKKKLAMLLAMSMVLGMSTNAFAATSNKATLPGEDGSKKTSISVNGEYLAELKSKEIISVDVEWDAMNFTYAAKQQGTWEPTDHTYRGSS